MKEHHIYFEWYLNERAGGPPGYIANLLLGLNRSRKEYKNFEIIFDNFSGNPPKKDNKKSKFNFLKEIIKRIAGRKIYAKYISQFQRKSYSDLINYFNSNKYYPNNSLIKQIDLSKTKTIHVHTALDALKVKNYLNDNFQDNIKVILTAHTPESFAVEQYNLMLESGQDIERAKEIRKHYADLESKGFKAADIIIYPSQESMEAHSNVLNFSEIISTKDVRFLATGTIGLHSNLSKEQAKAKFNVSGKKVISYLGRHNHIKGYDFLIELGKALLQTRNDVVFLIGGVQGKDILPLEHPNWIELGWVEPSDVLAASDLFLLPNRQTYYDLVLLEVMSMGIPVIASNTGGNKSVKRIVDEIELCELEVQEFLLKINKILSFSEKEWQEVSQNIKSSFHTNFTDVKMAERYIDVINSIYTDYNL